VAVSLKVGDTPEIWYFPDTFSRHNRRLRTFQHSPHIRPTGLPL
jgi:hypothetical protein